MLSRAENVHAGDHESGGLVAAVAVGIFISRTDFSSIVEVVAGVGFIIAKVDVSLGLLFIQCNQYQLHPLNITYATIQEFDIHRPLKKWKLE